MRAAALILLFSIAVSGGDVVAAQSERSAPDGAEAAPRQEKPDEVVVTGKQLGQLRAKVQTARELAYGIFNEINSTNDFDVHCYDETRPHSHAKQHVCRPQFEGRIQGQAGKDFLQSLWLRCPPAAGATGASQACMFSAYSAAGLAAAQATEGRLPGRRDQMNDEIVRLANDDPRFAQAILDYYEASQTYDAALKGRDAD